MILLKPPAWKTAAANASALRMFGVRASAELVNCAPWALSPDRQPDGRLSGEAARELIETALREGHHTFEWTHRRVTGEHFTVDVLLTRLAGGDKPILLATLREAADPNPEEEAERGSDERLKILFEYAPDAYYLHDLEGRFVDGNLAAEQMVGYRRDELIGKSFLDLDLLSPDDLAKAASLLVRSSQGEACGPQAFTLRRKDGRRVTAEMRTYPMKVGEQVLVLGLARDITERTRAEAALLRSEEQFRAMFELASIGMAQADVQTGQWVRVNQKMCEITGYSAEEMLQLRVPEVTHPEDRQGDWDAFQRVVRGEAPSYRREKRYLRKDGSVTWINVNMTVIRDAAGQPWRTMAAVEDISERKQAQQRIADALGYSRTLLDSVPIGIATYRGTGEAVSANLRVACMVGGTVEDVLAQNFRQLKSWQESGLLAGADAALTTGQTQHSEVHHRSTFGRNLWISATFVPFQYAGLTHLLALFEDITQRKEDQLHLATLCELGTKLSSARTDVEAAEVIVAAADTLFGWDACSLDRYSPEQDRVDPILNRDLVEGRRVDCESLSEDAKPSPYARRIIAHGAQLISRAGSEGFMPGGIPFGQTCRPSASAMYVPVRHDARVIGLLAIHSYTPEAYDERQLEMMQALADYCGGALERIRSHGARIEVEANYRALVDGSLDAIFVHVDQRFALVNPATLRLLRARTPEELLGRPIMEFVPPEVQEAGPDRLRRSCAANGSPWVEQKIRALDASLIEVEAAAVPVNFNGRPAVQTVMRDVTGRRRLESQLRQAQKMEAIGTLSGGIAHDFNNILGAILGNAALAQMEFPPSHPVQTWLEEITKASHRAADLVKRILACSRQEEQARSPMRLQPIIHEAVKLLRATIPSTVRLRTQVASDCPPVLADPTQIHQILMNLCTNAWHALPEEGGSIEVRLETVDVSAGPDREHSELHPGRYARIAVRDDGHGMDALTLERIFEPFFTTKPVGQGTGLGLAVVHGIVKSHDGVISVESRPGQGATFHIFLPAHDSEVPDDARPDPSTPRGAGQRILFVDDEDALAQSAARLLQSLGYRAVTETQPRLALRIFKEQPEGFDLVITDLTMPGMNGVELARRLLRVRPNLPVLLATGFSATLTPDSVRGLGIRDLLMKPIALESLGWAIHRAISSQEVLQP